MLLSGSLPLPSPPPPSVGISVGGVSSDLCRLMLTAADLLRPTTKRAGDKLSPPEAERAEAVWDGSTPGKLLSGRAEPGKPRRPPFSTWPTNTRTRARPCVHKSVHILIDGVN